MIYSSFPIIFTIFNAFVIDLSNHNHHDEITKYYKSFVFSFCCFHLLLIYLSFTNTLSLSLNLFHSHSSISLLLLLLLLHWYLQTLYLVIQYQMVQLHHLSHHFLVWIHHQFLIHYQFHLHHHHHIFYKLLLIYFRFISLEWCFRWRKWNSKIV